MLGNEQRKHKGRGRNVCGGGGGEGGLHTSNKNLSINWKKKNRYTHEISDSKDKKR